MHVSLFFLIISLSLRTVFWCVQPADWIMNVAQANPMEQLEKDGFFPIDDRKLPEPFVETTEGKDELGITLTEHHLAGDFDDSPPGIFTQLQMLFTREIKNISRDTASVGARFGLTIFLGLLVGLIFKGVGGTNPTMPQVRCSEGQFTCQVNIIPNYFPIYSPLIATELE
jgi:hypothetical protein